MSTEGEDSHILICADILSGTLETTVAAPFNISESAGNSRGENSSLLSNTTVFVI